MEYLLQRLCWNTNSYQYPSGETFNVDKGFSGEHGFGYEEWNFNTNDVIDGFCYGYMYQTPKTALSGKEYSVLFYTKDSDGQDFLIGMYRNAKFISNDERNDLKKRFEKTEIYQRRKQELHNLAYPKLTTEKGVSNYVLGNTHNENYKFPLNLKVKPKDIILLGNPIPIKNIFTERLNYHYTTAENISEKNSKLIPLLKIFNDKLSKISNLVEKERLSEEAYLRKSSESEKLIIPSHNRLSNSFQKYLDKKGYTNIKYEKNRIDVSAEKGNKSYMFELKIITTPYVRHGIREALGQLLEYNFYPDRDKFDYLAIVIDRKPSNNEISWCKNINNEVLEFELYWFDESKFTCANLVSPRK